MNTNWSFGIAERRDIPFVLNHGRHASGSCDDMTLDEALDRLGRSKFRSRFRLTASDRDYMDCVGLETIERHAADFVRERLAAAVPPNDGRQTPMHGHPAFKAMHATATCCRGCMAKWWKVPQGRPLSPSQQTKAVRLIMAWIIRNQACPSRPPTANAETP